MDRGLWTAALVGFLAPVALIAPFSAAEAGLLDWLFGRAEPAIVRSAHPDVTVSSRARHRAERRDRAERRTVRRSERREAKRKPDADAMLANVIDPKDMLARTIDPVKNPEWWRVDPTLRRGDILFLNDRVVVFVGKRPGDLASYVPVSQTRLVTAKQRRAILAMAGGGAPKVKAAAERKPKRERARLASLR